MDVNFQRGHLKIANEIWDALVKVRLGRAERQVLDAIFRKTFGFGKSEDSISISQFEEMTGLSRRQIIYCLQNLEAKRIIIIIRKRGRGIKNQPNRISLEKNPSKWVVQEKSLQYRKALNDRRKHYKKSKKPVVQEGFSSANADNIKFITDCLIIGSANKIRFLAPTIKKRYIKDSSKIKNKNIGKPRNSIRGCNSALRYVEDPPIPTSEVADVNGAKLL